MNKEEIRSLKPSNQNIPKLIITGGFLGSGKTTMLVSIGKRLLSQGKKVAIITNDQGEFLVDTRFIESNGFSTAEVLNGCFCCRFSDFIESITSTIEQTNPDFILAEPVGSCTDLLATVVTPLLTYYKSKINLAPLFILVDGSRLIDEYSKMDLKDPKTPKDLLVSHQIREAETILLSKIDLVDKATLDDGKKIILDLNPGAKIINLSTKTEEGLEQILELIINEEAEFKTPIPLDYNTYAQAEAEYGWYNGTWKINSEGKFNAIDFGMKLIRRFSDKSFKGEVAHAKLFLTSETCSYKLSYVMGVIQSDGVCSTNSNSQNAVLTFNVRARTTPEEISSHIQDGLDDISKDLNITVEDYNYEALVPQPPNPTYRLTERPGDKVGIENAGIILCQCSDRDFINLNHILDIQNRLTQYDVKFVINHSCICSKDAGLPVLSNLEKIVDKVIVIGCHKKAQYSLFESAIEKDKLIPINLRDSSLELVMEQLDRLLPMKNEIKTEWFPVIDNDKCNDCGQCLDFCLFGVYDKDEDGQVYVKNPYNCKDHCPACARVCPKSAICFPKCPEDWVAGADVPVPEYKKMSRDDLIKELMKKRELYLCGTKLLKGQPKKIKELINEFAGED